jgi:hypothetical protein
VFTLAMLVAFEATLVQQVYNWSTSICGQCR